MTPCETAIAISSAVEPEPPWKTRSNGLVLAHLGADLGLDVAEQFRTKLHGARLVHAVHVAEREGRQVAALLAEAEALNGREAVFRGRVQLLVDLCRVAVLFAADDADLDLEDRVRGLRELEQLLGQLEVLLERHRRAVEHVGDEQRLLAASDALGRDREQRAQPAVDVLRVAVVSVQRDGHAVRGGNLACKTGESDGAEHLVLDGAAGRVLGAADRNLDDAVRLGLREALNGRGDRRG